MEVVSTRKYGLYKEEVRGWTEAPAETWETYGSFTGLSQIHGESSIGRRLRFFFTPTQKRHLGSGDVNWRRCGTRGGPHGHIFWESRIIRGYWKEIQINIENVFGVKIPFKCTTMDMGDVLQNILPLQENGWKFKHLSLKKGLLLCKKLT